MKRSTLRSIAMTFSLIMVVCHIMVTVMLFQGHYSDYVIEWQDRMLLIQFTSILWWLSFGFTVATQGRAAMAMLLSTILLCLAIIS